jgi:leucyl aminopeptidase
MSKIILILVVFYLLGVVMSLKRSMLSAVLITTLVSASAFAEKVSFVDSVSTVADTLVLFHGVDASNSEFLAFNQKSQEHLIKAVKAQGFTSEYGSFLQVVAPIGLDYDRVLIVGTGKPSELNNHKLTALGGQLLAKLDNKLTKIIQVATDDFDKSNEVASLLAHGVSLRAHRFENYLSEKRAEKTFIFDVENAKQAQTAYAPLANIQQGVFLARDLTSEVPTEMTPVDFANAAKELKKLGVEIKVLKPKQLKKLGMGALEAVGRGSAYGSRLVIAHYKGSKEAPIAIVGKGITFDSGGYSIKTGPSIARMKSDMAGAAAALGTIKALALNKADINVVAIMGMAANMVSETSIAPGDVITTAEGLTVEVMNTDAEGRLVLSDALWYAREFYQPQIMVDLATLTGSKVGALGNRYAGLFSDDEELVTELTLAGKNVNENLWRLPLGYKDMLETDIADLRNTGTGGPGATTAASFLQYFVGDVRWAHLDIAGNALSSKAKDEVPTGGTGFGVRLLSDWLATKEK